MTALVQCALGDVELDSNSEFGSEFGSAVKKKQLRVLLVVPVAVESFSAMAGRAYVARGLG